MITLGQILLFALDVYWWIVVIEVIVNWLIIFNVINVRNDKAQNLLNLLKKVTEPVYSRIRQYIPPIGGLDLTPLVVLVGIWAVQWLVIQVFFINPALRMYGG